MRGGRVSIRPRTVIFHPDRELWAGARPDIMARDGDRVTLWARETWERDLLPGAGTWTIWVGRFADGKQLRIDRDEIGEQVAR